MGASEGNWKLKQMLCILSKHQTNIYWEIHKLLSHAQIMCSTKTVYSSLALQENAKINLLLSRNGITGFFMPPLSANTEKLPAQCDTDDAPYRLSRFFLLLHLDWQVAPARMSEKEKSRGTPIFVSSIIFLLPHAATASKQCQLQSTICKKPKRFDSQSLQLLPISRVELIHQLAAE